MAIAHFLIFYLGYQPLAYLPLERVALTPGWDTLNLTQKYDEPISGPIQ